MRDRGFTLVELLLVLGLLGLIAMMVAPGGVDQQRLALTTAANDVAQAMRYARNESIRRNEHFGVDVSADGSEVLLFRLNTTTTPNSFEYTLENPGTRQPYEVALTRTGERISAQPYFTFRTSSDAESALSFNPFGEPASVGNTGLLRFGGLVLSGDAYSVEVTVSTVGRVQVGELSAAASDAGNPFFP